MIKQYASLVKEKWQRIIKSSILRNYLWVFLGQNAGSVFSMITLIFTLRIINTEEYASLVVIQAYCLLISNLLSLRTFNGLIKYTTEALIVSDYRRVKQLFNTALIFDFTAGLASLICGYLFVDTITGLMGWELALKDSLLMYLPVVFFYPLLNGAPVGILRKLEKFKQVNLIHASVFGIQSLALMLLWISKAENYMIVFLVYEITEILECVAVVVLAIYVLQKDSNYSGFWKAGVAFDKGFLKYNLYYGLMTSFDQLLGNVSTLLINKYIGNFATAYLKVITKICSVITKLTKPVSQVFYPELCRWIAEKKYRKSIRVANQYFGAVNGIGILIGILFIVCYDSLCFLFGETMDGAKIQSLMYLAYSILSVAIVGYNQLVFAMNLMGKSLVLTMICDILYIVLLIPCIRAWDVFGYLGLQIVQLLIVFGVKCLFIRNELHRKQLN